ncbi:MAG: 3-methyladenine DNA glycosylase [Kiritimatiellia bacterium]
MQRAHEARMRPLVEASLRRRSRHEKDPVEDFLFEYYFHPPSHLLRWSPGVGVILRGEGAREFLAAPGFAETPDGVTADVAAMPDKRRESIPWVLDLQRAIQSRRPALGCLGLHEWAMVYDPADIRHRQLPLRLGVEGTRRVVESLPIRCTHFDAFRFFSPDARPLNRVQPGRDNRAEHEQPGCLHANMDLYQWAAKYAPWVESDLVVDCFDLALRIRRVDMRASAYDVSSLGLASIRIETPEGQEEYRALQATFAEEAAPLRARLVAALEMLAAPPLSVPT